VEPGVRDRRAMGSSVRSVGTLHARSPLTASPTFSERKSLYPSWQLAVIATEVTRSKGTRDAAQLDGRLRGEGIDPLSTPRRTD
jgi:hypothetical protein